MYGYRLVNFDLRRIEDQKIRIYSTFIVVSKIDKNRCKQTHWQVYLDFGRAGSLRLQLY